MDLDRFRRLAAGDRLRGQYQVSKQLSTDLEGNTTRAVHMYTAVSTKFVAQNCKSVPINDDWYYE